MMEAGRNPFEHRLVRAVLYIGKIGKQGCCSFADLRFRVSEPFNETGYPFVEVRREHIAGHAKRCLEEFKRQQRYLKIAAGQPLEDDVTELVDDLRVRGQTADGQVIKQLLAELKANSRVGAVPLEQRYRSTVGQRVYGMTEEQRRFPACMLGVVPYLGPTSSNVTLILNSDFQTVLFYKSIMKF